MKKLIRLLSLILSVVMSVSLFAGCDCKGGKDEDNDANVVTKVSNSSKVELYNFEEWNPDFSCIKLEKMFGVVRRNKDKDYCKSGNYSAKIQPIGGHIKTIAPVVWFPTSSSAWEFNYEDFSYVDYVSFWMYNDNDVDKDVTVGLVNKYSKFETISKLKGQTFNLKSKEWTHVKYFIDYGTLSITSDLNRSDMITTKGIYLEYEIARSSEVEDAPVYYMDDLTLVYKKTINGFDSPVNFGVDVNAKVKYLLTFDEIYQQNLPEIRQQDPISAPTQKVVSASEVNGIVPTTGSRMLQYNFPLMKASEGYKSAWHRWTIPEPVMRLFWQTYFYNPELDDPYIIQRQYWKDYYFCYDVYNASPFAYQISTKFYASDAKWVSQIDAGVIEPQPGQWSTVTISFEEIASSVLGLKEWEDAEGNLLQPDEYYTNDNRITDPGYLWITHNSTPYTNGGEDEFGNTIKLDDERITESFTRMTYYFDSFRVEYVKGDR